MKLNMFAILMASLLSMALSQPSREEIDAMKDRVKQKKHAISLMIDNSEVELPGASMPGAIVMNFTGNNTTGRVASSFRLSIPHNKTLVARIGTGDTQANGFYLEWSNSGGTCSASPQLVQEAESEALTSCLADPRFQTEERNWQATEEATGQGSAQVVASTYFVPGFEAGYDMDTIIDAAATASVIFDRHYANQAEGYFGSIGYFIYAGTVYLGYVSYVIRVP